MTPFATAPAERRVSDFGELPSTGSGPELVLGSRAARRGGRVSTATF